MPIYTHQGPFDAGLLQVDLIHQLHYQQYGLRTGLPVVFVHGGPGGQSNFSDTRFFDSNIYRTVLFDQRGAGRSLPKAELKDNTTHHLVADIERLRIHLGISKWHMVFGGSWGSTLALLYTQTHPDRVGSLVLRGVLAARESELRFSRGSIGAANLFPDKYEQFISFLPEGERHNPYTAYCKRILSNDIAVATPAAVEWNRWAIAISSVTVEPEAYEDLENLEQNLSEAKLEAHYFSNRAWLEDGQLLEKANMEKMKHIPGAIVQGRYDILTPPQTAWELHKLWPKAELHWIDAAGHSANEPAITAKLVEICDSLARLKLRSQRSFCDV